MMVGDSLKDDVLGAHKVGMVTVWINRSNKEIGTKIKPDYTIENLFSLVEILQKKREK